MKALPAGHREHLTEYRPAGHWTIREGMEIRVRGERGTFRFRYAVVTHDDRVWLELIGPDGVMAFKAVAPDRVRSIPRRQGTMRGQKKPTPAAKKVAAPSRSSRRTPRKLGKV